jgi:lipoate-protein ligase A
VGEEAANMNCRLLVDREAPGAWNMAVDEAMLHAALARPDRGPTLRWYGWREPTLSLGYFQSWRDRPTELVHVPFVRRITGGGAIRHDAELTYSLILPAGGWPRLDNRQLVFDVHWAMTAALGATAPATIQRQQAGTPANRSDPPFLCFERFGLYDVLLGPVKIMGSAQRNRRGGLLQHGSIVLERWSAELDRAEFLQAIQFHLSRRWGWTFTPGRLDPAETDLAHELVETKYNSQAWNQRR